MGANADVVVRVMAAMQINNNVLNFIGRSLGDSVFARRVS